MLKKWIEKNDPAAVQQLCDLLVTGNQSEIDSKIRSINEEILKLKNRAIGFKGRPYGRP